MISKLIPFFYAYSLFFWYCFLPTTAASGNETDLLSLIFIRDSVRGLSSWNNSSHFCQWKGVTCGTSDQRVVALNLSSLNLFGHISPHIGNLSFLQLISFKDNQLNGQIPEEISQLFRLQYVDLSNNAFGGNISANLSQCTELRTIIFAENALSGVIPPRLGSLPNLRVLALEKNNLTGEIPPSLGNLTSLRFFILTDNSFHGSIPDAFHNMPNLTYLQFGGNHFSGQLSQSLFNISSLKDFSVASNNITGSLPPDFGLNLPNLEMFCLGENQFFGALPVSLANISNLVQFDVSSNNFTGPIPINFGASQNFREINLGFNHLGLGKADDLMFISYLVNSSNLQILALDKNNFGGEFPNSITDLSTQMEMLYLGGNQISGVIPEAIGNLVNLIGLGLQLNLFHGNIPSSLGQMQKLQRLLLQGNRFTGLIPSSIGSISQLSVLSLANNRLEGRIPSSLGDCQNLKSLNLSRNNLNGSIPEPVMGISSLSNWLDLSRNSLTGSIPLSVGSLKNLVRIDLSDNKLSGVIPSTLSNCLSLERLFLDNNMIQGPIPLSLSSLRIIQYIDLSSNSLSGGIPKYLESFQYLMRLNLSSNQFVGEVPVEGVFRNASRISVNENIKLCGGIQELRLQKCETKGSKKDGRSLRIILITIGTVLSVLVTLSFLYICWKRNKDRPPPLIHPFQVSGEFSHIQVSYRDLFQATGGFSEMNFVGSGGFGRVYRGYLKLEGGKRVVAIKVFNLDAKGASKSFMDECKSLSNIRHRNLVKIITSCSSTDFEGNDFKALVFEFMSNGSLEMWLHGDGGGPESPLGCLDLLQRLNVAIDIASALKYLHHQCQIPIIHCDMKPSNVLLDNDMVARVGDFGLAKFLSGSMKNLDFQQSTTIAVKGTVGYVPPEYGTCDDVSTKGDVYSFGVLLLELFTGRRPTDEIFIDGLNLHKFATVALNTRIMEIVDPVLLSQEEEEHNIENGEERSQVCIASGIRVGVTCSSESPGERMNMEEVVKELNAIRDDFLANLQQKERSSVSNY